MRVRSVGTCVVGVGCLSLLGLSGACSGSVSLFNPAFINSVSGGQVPVTPGPGASMVLVRVINETNQVVEFIVTIEREVLVQNDDGSFQIDDQGNFITRPQRQTARLNTAATGLATEIGALFDCSQSPVTVVGLGENLLPTDAAIFVGGGGAGGAAGFGVQATDVNPLRLDVGNFNCGDTIIFRAFQSVGAVGGTRLQSFLLPGSEQPSIFSGPSTFTNLEQFLASQVEEQEGP